MVHVNDLVFLRHLCISCTGSGMFRYPRAIRLEREVFELLERKAFLRRFLYVLDV
jgi:hypothetical protein